MSRSLSHLRLMINQLVSLHVRAAAVALVILDAVSAAPAVVVSEARVVNFPVAVEAPGTAQANESIEIRPHITETIEKIRFEEGQQVQAGDILVELDDAQLQAAVAEARAQLVDSESQFRRARELFETRAVSASELERLEASRDADRAVLAAAQSRLQEAIIRAPFAGRVGLRRVSPGSLVSPDTVITTLDDTSIIKLDFDVPETALSKLATGLTVRARSAAYPDAVIEGAVSAIDTRVDPVTRTVRVRALVDNRDGLLRPGMFLAVTAVQEDVRSLVIPEQALVPEQSRQYVLVVGDDRTVEKREVRTGRRRPGQVEILDGLTPGETVIAEGTQKARPGEPVEIVGRLELPS